MKSGIIGLMVLILFGAVIVQPAVAAVTPYFNDLAGFSANAGVVNVAVDFDTIAPGTDIDGATYNGITFSDNGGALPIVIAAADSFTPAGFSWSSPGNVLVVTSGANVLSPGGPELAPGPNAALENDDMVLTFSTPVKAAGFDLLFQSLDGSSFVAVTVLDSGGNSLYSNGFIPIPSAAGSAGGSTFIGFVSDTDNIAKIVIDDFDENNVNPDSNIGMDTVRASVPINSIPEFPTLAFPVVAVTGMMLAIVAVRKI